MLLDWQLVYRYPGDSQYSADLLGMSSQHMHRCNRGRCGIISFAECGKVLAKGGRKRYDYRQMRRHSRSGCNLARRFFNVC